MSGYSNVDWSSAKKRLKSTGMAMSRPAVTRRVRRSIMTRLLGVEGNAYRQGPGR
jgi:hypothetical protein